MRNEIEKECEFLDTWSLAFHALKKQEVSNMKMWTLETFHQAAVDAKAALKGESMAWHDDESIIINLTEMKFYMRTLNSRGYFGSMQSFKQAEALCQSVINMLSVASPSGGAQGSLF
jgi:hypothetical protein